MGRTLDKVLVPLAGIEPALLAELDFESSASTSSATGASGHKPQRPVAKPAEYSRGQLPVNPRGCDIGRLDSAVFARYHGLDAFRRST